MREQLEALKNKAIAEINNINNLNDLESIRVAFLGKKGALTAILRQMGQLANEERPVIGQLANEIRETIENLLKSKKEIIEKNELEKKLINEKIDITMPGKRVKVGRKHPITQVLDEIKDTFIGMGFEIAEGPEIELVHYNFDALNETEDHPARDESDTFYINKDILLRTQTSPVQVRYMEKNKPPIKMIAPGRVYRKDEVDSTHSPLFHQIEGLVVDKNVTMADLKGTLETFIKNLFGQNSKVRFRPHHFPFTEPSAEVDICCFACDGAGCRLCKGEGWIEILGAGMVHPKVLENCGIDPKEYSGFAFGLGLERIVMRRFNIDDLRLLFENDIRFLNQF